MVLAVEDDASVRQSAVVVLEAHGYGTREAEDSAGALEALRLDIASMSFSAFL